MSWLLDYFFPFSRFLSLYVIQKVTKFGSGKVHSSALPRNVLEIPYIPGYKSLNTFWITYFQSDLYSGRTISSLTHLFMRYIHLLRPNKCFDEILKMSILNNFLDLFFWFNLYAGRWFIHEYKRYIKCRIYPNFCSTCDAVLKSDETSEDWGQISDDCRQESDHAERAEEAEPAAGNSGRRNKGKDDLRK